MLDIIIKNGKIVDGSGNPWCKGEVGIKDGKLAAVGYMDSQTEAREILDATGKVVCPGFVDSHSHSDLGILGNPLATAKIMQGVTTENLGLDSYSLAPIRDQDKTDWALLLSGLAGKSSVNWSWNSFGDYLDAIDGAKPSVNISSYVGLGTVRNHVMGMTDRPPTPQELESMRQLVDTAMQEGARGVSAGLIYTPNKFQSAEEIMELTRVAAAYDGLFDVHIRNEADHMDEALDEVINIGRKTGIRVLVTHFKCRGKANWGKAQAMLHKVDEARQQGVDVTIAQYPYAANSTLMHVVIPPWYHKRGMQGLLKALRDEREQIKQDMLITEGWENFSQVMGWENIFVSSVESSQNAWCEGQSVLQIAEKLSVSPADAVCDLLLQEQLAVGLLGFGMSEDDVLTIMRHPTMCVITDSLLSGKKPHPRTYASYPRLLARYVREKQVLTLEEAVRKMSFAGAQRLRLPRKGMLIPGWDADVVVFDETAVLDCNTFENPLIPPQGIEHVLVNGEFVVKDSRHTGARPGKTIRGR